MVVADVQTSSHTPSTTLAREREKSSTTHSVLNAILNRKRLQNPPEICKYTIFQRPLNLFPFQTIITSRKHRTFPRRESIEVPIEGKGRASMTYAEKILAVPGRSGTLGVGSGVA